MLFITNREPSRSTIGGKFKFDLDKNSPTASVFFCERNAKNNYTEIGSQGFFQALKKCEARQLLFYIHGFSNLPEPNIFPSAKTLQSLFDKHEQNFMQVIPLIWPCDNDTGILEDYWDDQKSADQSAYSFARALEKFRGWQARQPEDDPCFKRINILAHSMGARVFRETLQAWNKYDLADGVPLFFRNSILMAPDIINESLEVGKRGELISHASRNVSVYFASDDLALRASKVVNVKNRIASRRLGHSGPENMGKVLSNVYAIDCDRINTDYDTPKGHSYYMNSDQNKPGEVFKHLYNSLWTGRVTVNDPATNRHII